jgi:hypothetical protein
MKLQYLHSYIVPCVCSWTSDYTKMKIDNINNNEPLNKKIEFRHEKDDEDKEHIKRVVHCDECTRLQRFTYNRPVFQ